MWSSKTPMGTSEVVGSAAAAGGLVCYRTRSKCAGTTDANVGMRLDVRWLGTKTLGSSAQPGASCFATGCSRGVLGSIPLKHGEANHESGGSLRDAVRQSQASGQVLRVGVWLADAAARRGNGQLRTGDDHGNGPDWPQKARRDQRRLLREKA